MDTAIISVRKHDPLLPFFFFISPQEQVSSLKSAAKLVPATFCLTVIGKVAREMPISGLKKKKKKKVGLDLCRPRTTRSHSYCTLSLEYLQQKRSQASISYPPI